MTEIENSNSLDIDIQPVAVDQQSASTNGEIDLESIRLTQHFSDQVGVKKLLTTIPVRKPNRTVFFLTHPEYRMDVMLLKYGETDEPYIVTQAVFQEVSQLAKPYRLALTVDTMGTSSV